MKKSEYNELNEWFAREVSAEMGKLTDIEMLAVTNGRTTLPETLERAVEVFRDRPSIVESALRSYLTPLIQRAVKTEARFKELKAWRNEARERGVSIMALLKEKQKPLDLKKKPYFIKIK